jgi:hypothetical protein
LGWSQNDFNSIHRRGNENVPARRERKRTSSACKIITINKGNKMKKKMKKAKDYHLVFYFRETRKLDMFEQQKLIEKEMKRYSSAERSGSGYSFLTGERDLCYNFGTKNLAEKAATRIKKTFRGVKAKIYEPEVETAVR